MGAIQCYDDMVLISQHKRKLNWFPRNLFETSRLQLSREQTILRISLAIHYMALNWWSVVILDNVGRIDLQTDSCPDPSVCVAYGGNVIADQVTGQQSRYQLILTTPPLNPPANTEQRFHQSSVRDKIPTSSPHIIDTSDQIHITPCEQHHTVISSSEIVDCSSLEFVNL